MSNALFSGLSKLLRVPGGNLAKAASVGAKTVNGPGLFNVGTRSPACRAITKILKLPFAIAVSTISAILAKHFFLKKKIFGDIFFFFFQ